MIVRFKMIASGYVFFIREGKILLSKRKNTGYMDGWYSVPAGHIENNESLIAGTVREISEETGVHLTEKQIRFACVMHRKEDDIRMDFFFVVDDWEGEPVNAEPEKCDELRWFPIGLLPENTIPYIRIAIENLQKKIFYSEVGW
mgnify:CR=1 FL=1